MILESFLALVGSTVAAGGIYLSWRNSSAVYAWLGWLAAAGSVYCWYLVLGVEYGLTIGLCLPALTVWAAIAVEANPQRQSTARIKPAHQWRLAPRQIALQTGHILYVLPGQLFICALIMIAVVYQLPVSEPKQMAIGVLVMPVLWGLLAYWYGLSSRKWLHIAISSGAAVVAGLWLFGGAHG
ncbi:MAG: hypothetical protein CBB67_001090 [Alteromonadaceae bacterium TMED7]|uniref:Uncharacterized protein n=1 Tax=Alteromonas alba TaxID=2079529 RepID=A0A2S9V9U7_9ALTE|nr:hypothetical protein [Alteromonas alba]MAJ70142.1 hypothetical protein [Alteromonadaceae bacterium]PRO73085.1 hypothetical protein C6Y40_13345 [Alteromonas alba]RPH23008.1 MAG: hypothetical protein CBB67_001090 [Alteromonadaceae bacterium TMED7]|tara:strand:- start:4239 stop:4787 length:549 start_codon:yes stop_codon:yes gene_type:complete